MEFTFQEDKPRAIAGLEQRLASALRTRSVAGVFEKYWGHCLLWENIKLGLTPISSPRLKVSLPSWSWMGYEEPIQYMDVESVGVEWSKKIKLPFHGTSSLSNDRLFRPILIEAEAYRFTLSAQLVSLSERSELQTRLYFDDLSRIDADAKCVIIGTRRGYVSELHGTSYYVLLISSKTPQSSTLLQYRRVGVGLLGEREIMFDGPLTLVTIE
jgi:hypothetical protein